MLIETASGVSGASKIMCHESTQRDAVLRMGWGKIARSPRSGAGFEPTVSCIDKERCGESGENGGTRFG